ncbi:MAG: NfeD family protein [Ruminococcus sp.]|nr:NfeD family protein [Ruminococcus sp.]
MELTWAILFVVFVIAEFTTVQLISIWFAFGSLAALLCTHFLGLSVPGQVAVFLIVSAILLAVTFPIVRKRLNTSRVPTNNDLDIGKNATVIEEINHDKGTGRVTLNGVDWSAVPENKTAVISAGSIVVVKEVQGAKLIVALKDKSMDKTAM